MSSLLNRHGYRHSKPWFDDKELEQAYRQETFVHVFTQWHAIIKVLMGVLVVLYAIHWIANDNVSALSVTSEIILFAIVFIPFFLRHEYYPKGREFFLTSTLVNAGQCAALFLVAYGYETSDAILVIGYLTIFVGGVAPNILSYQAVAAVSAAIGFSILLFTIPDFNGQTLAYHLGFTLFTAAVSLSVSANREASERLTFLLNLRAEALLRNVLPEKIADLMRDNLDNELSVVERFDDVSVLFADLVGFTAFASDHSPEDTVRMLSDVFRAFDSITEKHGIEKIKTIGDAYMAVCGLPEACPDHTHRIADAAFEMHNAFIEYCKKRNFSLELRIGLHRGPVIAGVIGTKKFLYDLWGDTVNIASRLESRCAPGQILVSASMVEALRINYKFGARAQVDIKGKGLMDVFVLEGPKSGENVTELRTAA